jgi:hypothetical protein
VALAVGAFLLPWSAVLGATLPATMRVPNWSLAWMGLDFAEAIAALVTAVLLSRGSPRAGVAAAAGAALLFADAWFDVCTSPPGLDRALAAGEAAVFELPLAAAAIWLAVTLTGRRARPLGRVLWIMGAGLSRLSAGSYSQNQSASHASSGTLGAAKAGREDTLSYDPRRCAS